MSVILNISDSITFERPLTRQNHQNIRVENPHNQPVAFKVKTTAPRIYCVRPNSEIIPANSAIDVQIAHQAFKEEPSADIKCKDKFLLLSTFVTEKTENMELSELWTYAETNDKANIHQHKLRCIYGQLPAAAAAAPVEPVVPVTTTTTTTTPTAVAASAAVDNSEDVNEKLRQMQDELSRYKEQVKTLREQEPVVVEKIQVVKQSSNPFSIIILLALFVAAVAYFVKF